jgi:hypothetical protein
MFDYRAKVLTMASIGALVGTIAACDDPVSRTDLRTEGAPDIMSVLAMNDSKNGILETAVFCKTGDAKRPALVGVDALSTSEQVCPDDLGKGAGEVTNAVPSTWFARVQFDQLLDPDIEELLPNPDGTFKGSLANTQPVILKCGGKDVVYDGYYAPNGNNVSWPVGPSLFIKPTTFAVPTGTPCELTVKDNVVDKQGNPVDAAKRGPFKFSIESLALRSTEPAKLDTAMPQPVKRSTKSPFKLVFNAPISLASIDKTKIKLFSGVSDTCTGGTAVPSASIATGIDGMKTTIVTIADATAPAPKVFNVSKYRLEFAGATLKDTAGGAGSIPDTTVLCISAED